VTAAGAASRPMQYALPRIPRKSDTRKNGQDKQTGPVAGIAGIAGTVCRLDDDTFPKRPTALQQLQQLQQGQNARNESSRGAGRRGNGREMQTGGGGERERERDREIKREGTRGAPASSRKGSEMETGGDHEELGTASKLSEDSGLLTGGVCGMHALSCGARYALNLLALLVQTLLALLVQTYKY
jgi:hypothetical protein